MMRSSKAQTVQRALDILHVFLDNKGEASLQEIGNSTGLSVSTIYRILSVLVENGYINHGDNRGKYLIGVKFLEFGSVVKSALKIEDIARPFMEKLQKRSNESVHISRSHGTEMSYLEIIHTSQILRVVPVIGTKVPLHCTAAGKVFLAQLKKAERERLFKKGKALKSYTKNTITDIKALHKQLEVVKKDGVAIDIEECVPGITDIAAPVIDSDGKLGACIGIFIPSPRATKKKISSLVSMVKDSALEISHAIGYRG